MDWDDLYQELERWRAMDRAATLWWRDDDAADGTPALARLLDAAERAGAPLALAVVPATATEALVRAVNPARGVSILQHGYAHTNHAGPGARAIECGGDRPVETVLSELSHGRRRLVELFADRFRPVLVPPWNRIDDAVAGRIAEAGFSGLSTWGRRPATAAAVGVVAVNTHADLIAWRSGRRFAGVGKVLGEIVRHLADRREGRADPSEPTGILTHHLDHDEAGWAFLAELTLRLGDHPAARWIDVDAAFGFERAR
jgi:hypothetical protein